MLLRACRRFRWYRTGSRRSRQICRLSNWKNYEGSTLIRAFILFFGSLALFGATVPDRFNLEVAGEPAVASKSRLASIRDRHKAVRAAAAQANAEVLDSLEN